MKLTKCYGNGLYTLILIDNNLTHRLFPINSKNPVMSKLNHILMHKIYLACSIANPKVTRTLI